MTMFKADRKWMDDARFLVVTVIILMVFFAVIRGLLLWRNITLAADIPWHDLARSFLVGMRFDLAIASYIVLPPVFGLILFGGLGRRTVVRVWVVLITSAVLFAAVVELDFYYEFHNRLNNIAFQYLKEDPATVSNMLWPADAMG